MKREFPSKQSGSIFELLETRRLMCALEHPAGQHVQELTFTGPIVESSAPADIVWTNRGTSISDSDRFNSVFGANAENARKVVDAVLTHFERMIGSFVYADGTANYNLSLSMASSGTSLGASASLSSTLNGKPKSGSVSMGRGNNGAGGGWFIDPTPDDNSEFLGNITNAFSGDAPVGSPARSMNDFYTVVCSELTHCLGLFGTNANLTGFRNLTTNTAVPDTAEGGGIGTYYTFDGPSVKHLLTSNNGGSNGSSFSEAIHSAGPTASTTVNGTQYIGSQSIGNAIYESSRRYIPDLVFSLIFKDSYNYESVNPAQFGSFYSALNDTTGNLLVRGGTTSSLPGSNDQISLSLSGSTLTVSVNVGRDVAGTGATPGAEDLPAWVSQYDISQISSITIQAGDATDTIDIDVGALAAPITVDAGASDDTINVISADNPVSIVAGGPSDRINIGAAGAIAKASLSATQILNTVNIAAGGELTLANGMTLKTASLDIDAAGVLDLGSGAVAVDYTGANPFAPLRAAILSGAIRSSLASVSTTVGYLESTQIFSAFPASFAGVIVDDSAVLMRYTLRGDTDLNRTVDIADFSNLAANFNNTDTLWFTGDFDGDAVTDIADFASLAGNFNQTLARFGSSRILNARA